MARVKDAREAMGIVRSQWHPGDPEMVNMTARRRGLVWVVKYDDLSVRGTKHEVHIKAETGEFTMDE